jgi:hypothetical protein
MDIRERDNDLIIRITDTGRGFVPAFVASIDEPIDTISLAKLGLDKGQDWDCAWHMVSSRNREVIC